MIVEGKVKIYGSRLLEKEIQNIKEHVLKTPHEERISCIEIYTTLGMQDERDVKEKIEGPYGHTLSPEEAKEILDHLQKIPHQNIISNIKIQLV